MKKTMLMIAIAALAAGSAFAQEGNNTEQGNPQGKKAWNRSGGKQAWSQRDERGNSDRERGGKQAWSQDKRGGQEDSGGPMMDPAMREQMRADHKAIRELGDAARAETDAAKKAELVVQLRAKLVEVADRMQANQEKRLAQAEERLSGLKAKIEEAKANRATLIDEQVQRILSGERPQRPERFNDFPNAKGGRHGGPGGMAPAGEDMLDDAPPPAE